MGTEDQDPLRLVQNDHGIPWDEVLGEAEAKYGPMPACIRSMLLPTPVSIIDGVTQEPTPELPGGCPLLEGTTNSAVEIKEEVQGDITYHEDHLVKTSDSSGGGISLDDIAFSPSPLSLSPANVDFTTRGIADNASDVGQTLADNIFLDLDDEHDDDGQKTARRSPDSGCSMSEASVEDKISIASSVSSASDDLATSKLDKQIMRLREAMNELREQDVDLARQLLIVYDYVEETKWFLENFEACDPRHSTASIIGSMTSSERRFSQNFQKRMSDFGLNYLRGASPSTGYSTPPAWMEAVSMSASAKKCHNRNVSDGLISMENLRRNYHENNNNNQSCGRQGERVEFYLGDESGLDNDSVPEVAASNDSVTRSRSPKSMTRRSVSSNFLEVSMSSSMTNSDQTRQQRPLEPISDAPQICHDIQSDNHHVTSSMVGDGHENTNDVVSEVERTTIIATTSLQEFNHPANDHGNTNLKSRANHHQGSPSSSSASSMTSSYSTASSSSYVDASDHAYASPIPPKPNSTSTPCSIDPTADDCSIFIDDAADDAEVPMSPFQTHMNWLQGQDETLL